MTKKYQSPAYYVIPVPLEKVIANDYNPNRVAEPEMRLLELSIWEDGFTVPIVCYHIKKADLYIVVDGFHRYLVMKTSQRIYEREQGIIPVVVIDKPIADRMASTIRHNRARGTHCIDQMVNIIKELIEIGKSDAWISRNMGMDKDELLRLKQTTGLAEMFKDRDFSLERLYLEKDDISPQNTPE